jgi:hypothetical protein
LVTHGFARDDISVIAHDHLRHEPTATALLGAGVGAAAGGLIGALTDLGIPEEQ